MKTILIPDARIFADITRKALCVLFLLSCFFPFLTLVNLGTDIQPYALVFAVLIVAITRKKELPLEIILLLFAFLFSLVLLIPHSLSFYSMRSVGNYASLFFISAATYFVLKRDRKSVIFFIEKTAYVWLAVGLIQNYINPDFMMALIPNMSTDEFGRGVTSLATEPSFYGIFCIFLLLLNYFHNSNNKKVILILLFQTIFLAKSGISIVFLLLFLFYMLLFRGSIKIFLLFVIIGLSLYALVNMSSEQNLRYIYLFSSVITNPQYLLMTDTSVNARISHAFFSIDGFIDNYFLPHGFGAFHNYLNNALSTKYPDYVWLGSMEEDMKIMSGYGAALFELGFIGLLIPLAVVMPIYKYFASDKRNFLLFSLFISTLMFAAVQLSHPLLGLFIGYTSYIANERFPGTEDNSGTAAAS